MSVVTKIIDQKRRPGRVSVFLDGKFTFGCSQNVIARFKLREGLTLSDEQVRAIEQGQIKQECFDAAMKCLERRLHGRAELGGKLKRQDYGEGVIASVMDELCRLGYVDDERFARTRALAAAERKQHGRHRAMLELRRIGVAEPVARKALDDVYQDHDTLAVARQLAQKQASRLRKLDPVTARRRLAGMLQRRGFEYQDVRPVIDQVLGPCDDTPPE